MSPLNDQNRDGSNPDWLDLACDAATGDLATADLALCEASRHDHAAEFDEFDRIAAALAVGLTPIEQAPGDVRDRLMRTLPAIEAEPIESRPLRVSPPASSAPKAASLWRSRAIAGWSIAALLALVAGVILIVRATPPQAPSPADARRQLIARGATPIAWGEWSDPSVQAVVQGVRGDVVWDDQRQEGYMRFVGLPTNDPSEAQYQLWILDGRYEDPLSQRVSGGVFDIPPGAEEWVVPIRQGMPIEDAVGFAITVERPGGVWVSDMSQRVAIALKG